MNPQNPNIQEILKTISQFGFNYFGNDENGAPLVYAPNGQVVPLDVAYNFVRNQIEQSKNSSGSSAESMPQMPQASPERSLETNVEQSLENVDIKKPETKVENQQNQVQGPSQVATNPTPAPVIAKPKPLPFGEGFKPKSFDATDVTQALKFIEDNKKQSDKSSNKWLAIQFEKFLNEIKAGKP